MVSASGGNFVRLPLVARINLFMKLIDLDRSGYYPSTSFNQEEDRKMSIAHRHRLVIRGQLFQVLQHQRPTELPVQLGHLFLGPTGTLSERMFAEGHKRTNHGTT